jgi:hypothetical protein
MPVLAAAVVLMPLMAQAQTYTAVNKLKVVPLGGSEFEVLEARGEGARGIWCAAAEFADTRMRMAKNHRIYIKSKRGPAVSAAGRKGVVFTSKASAVQPVSSYSVSVRQEGLGLPVTHALQFCRDYEIELDNILFNQRKNR